MPFPDQNWPYSLFLSQRSSAGLRLYQPGVGEGAVLTIIPGVNTTITCIDSFEIAAVHGPPCSLLLSAIGTPFWPCCYTAVFSASAIYCSQS